MGRDFLIELIAAMMKKSSFFAKTYKKIKPSFIKDEALFVIFNDMKNHYELHEKVPTFGVLSLLYLQDKNLKKVLNEIKTKALEDIDEDIILESFIKFHKYSRFVESYENIGLLWNSGKKEKAYEAFVLFEEEIIQEGDVDDDVTRLFTDFEKRNVERLLKPRKNRISTQIDEIDDELNGGPEAGEYCLWLADSGIGKSFLAIHLGVAAARQGYKVFHAQLEGTREQVEDRYDSNWSGTPYFDMKKGDISPEKVQKYKKLQSQIKGEVHIKSWVKFDEAYFDDILATFKQLKLKYSDDPDEQWVVIIDYLDLIQVRGLDSNSKEERFRQSKVSKQHKNLAVSENCLVHGFTQASSIKPEQLEDPEFVITRYNLAEDKGKVRPVDYLITLNQTKEEKKKKILRLYIDKAREHVGNVVITIKTNLKHSRFYNRKATLDEEFYIPE